MSELIIIENNAPLADSRVVAEELGVQHGPFMTNIILKYQKEVEAECGVVHFKNGKPLQGSSGGRPERYALLTEVQANAYLSLARNTSKAVTLKIKLAKAFDDAKKIIAELLKQQTSSALPFNKDVQQRCLANEKLLPQGYWCVVNEMYKEALIVIPFQKELKDWTLPDGSCGRKWRVSCERDGIDLSQSFKHALWVPNQKFLVGIYIYPYNLLDTFRAWLRVEYAQYYEHEYSPSRLKGVEDQQINAPKKRGWLR